MISYARAGKRFKNDCFNIGLSVLVAWFLSASGILSDIISATADWGEAQSFVAGFFFTSLFTLVPATAVLVELTQTASLFSVAFYGAIGGVVGDLVLFKIFREHILGDATFLFRDMKPLKAAVAIFHSRFFRFLTPLLGAFLLASPLPDEPALALMGLVRISFSRLIIISFVLHFLGILALAGVVVIW